MPRDPVAGRAKSRKSTIDVNVLMNWKATAAVSSATLLAGWLASAPPSLTTPAALPSAAQSPQATAAASDIGQLAARLQAQTRRDAGYGEPERNLFRFGQSVPVRSAASPP